MLPWVIGIHSSDHKYYVSKTEMELSPRSGMMEVALKFFTDDLERALMMGGSGPLRLSEQDQHPEAAKLIETYIRKHWLVNMNGQNVYPTFVGVEAEMDMTVAYFEFMPAPAIHQLTITQDALMEVFEEQKNVVDVTMFGSTHTLVLTRDRRTDTVYR
jgi:uncharacterized protein YukJ